MRARQLIAAAAFAPQIVRAMEQAFDQAWSEIAGNFGDSPSEIQSAIAMLSVASETGTDVATLKASALQTMALSYRARSAS